MRVSISGVNRESIVTSAYASYKRTQSLRRVVDQILFDVSHAFNQKDIEIRNLKEELNSTKKKLEIAKKTQIGLTFL